MLALVEAVMTFGQKLVELRTAAGLSQPQLAKKCCVTVWALRAWEHDRRHPTWKALLDIAEALGVQAEAFKECRNAPRPRRRSPKQQDADEESQP
jgi:transcriptional regulator with XRE-family HTH domain